MRELPELENPELGLLLRRGYVDARDLCDTTELGGAALGCTGIGVV